MTRRLVHLITPGDHFSPRTGSAVPTVVHGVSAATPPGRPRPGVLVAAGTFPERYDSAEVIEYAPVHGRRTDRYVDALAGRLGLPRFGARRQFAAALVDQDAWPDSTLLIHNAPPAVPLVAPRHRGVLWCHNTLFRSYSAHEARATLGPAAGVISVSDALADLLRASLPADLHDKIRVVRNGVDVTGFAADLDRPRQGPLQVMFVGRMVPYKGPDLILDAVARLDRDDIAVTLVGGSGFSADGELTDYERQIRVRGATLRRPAVVRPFVPRAEVASTLVGADVIVVPSRWPDPCPLTVLEGMAAGAAVIGAEIGGIPESVAGAGLSFPAEDVDALADLLAGLADDDALLDTVRRRCRVYAESHDWASVHTRLDAALTDLAAS